MKFNRTHKNSIQFDFEDTCSPYDIFNCSEARDKLIMRKRRKNLFEWVEPCARTVGWTVSCIHLAVQQVYVWTVNSACYFLTGYCADHSNVAVFIWSGESEYSHMPGRVCTRGMRWWWGLKLTPNGFSRDKLPPIVVFVCAKSKGKWIAKSIFI